MQIDENYGLLDKKDGRFENSARALFSNKKRDLVAANWIVCNDTMAWIPPL